jgi:hypothetical protein
MIRCGNRVCRSATKPVNPANGEASLRRTQRPRRKNKSFTAEDAEGAKENKSFAAEDAESAKEKKSLTAKAAKAAKAAKENSSFTDG